MIEQLDSAAAVFQWLQQASVLRSDPLDFGGNKFSVRQVTSLHQIWEPVLVLVHRSRTSILFGDNCEWVVRMISEEL